MLPSIDVRKSGSKREKADTEMRPKKRSIRFSDEVDDPSTGPSKAKIQRNHAPQNDLHKTSDNSSTSNGMEKTIREMLSNYTPASHQKLPFYCRICQHQANDEIDFYTHKKSEFHQLAVNLEQKMTYCKVCRKQFTSLIQLEEHLSSSKHKATMDRVIGKQQHQQSRASRSSGVQWS
jgi:hypothetical protein